MENEKNATQNFQQFAEEKLQNHIAELNTRYENEKPDKETMEQAFIAHRKIYLQELCEKLKSFSLSQNHDELKDRLENIKKSFVAKFDKSKE
jgi:superoxide dismutase